jgi:hypothetical protein
MPTRCLRSSRQTKPTRTFYNPVGYDPAEVLPLHLHGYADYARYFLHVLYSQRVFKDIKDQGQRTLNRCSGNDFQQELFVPTATAPFHDETRPVRMLFQE